MYLPQGLLILAIVCYCPILVSAISYAAWSTVDVPEESRPNATCDHVGAKVDDHTFLTYGGGDGSDYYFVQDNVWTFDILETEWTIHNNSVDKPPMRASPSVRATEDDMWMFGGYTYTTSDEYLSDLWRFDYTTYQWTEYTPSGDVPPERAWGEVEWVDAEHTKLGILYGSELSVYADDFYIYDTVENSFTKISSEQCLTNGSICDDPYTPLQEFINSTCIRSAPVPNIPEYYDLFNHTMELLHNMTVADLLSPLSCTDGCVESEVRISDNGPTPNFREGHRMTEVNDTHVFLYGGYSCHVDGTWNVGGPACFDNSIWFLDRVNLEWTEVSPDDSEHWPVTGRGYHVQALHDNKIWMFGGGYLDKTLVLFFRNDVMVFDLITQTFDEVRIFGDFPPIMWSASSILFTDDWYIYGGCSGDAFYNDIRLLKLGSEVFSDQVLVDSPALSSEDVNVTASTTAGESLVLSLAMVDPAADNLELTWATGLQDSFDASLVETVSGNPIVNPPLAVVDLGNGQYEIQFTPVYGPEAELHLFFEGTAVPGSPFLIEVTATTAAAEQFVARTIIEDYPVKGEVGVLAVVPRDQYRNVLAAHEDYLGNLSATVDWVKADGSVVTEELVLSDLYVQDAVYMLEFYVKQCSYFEVTVTFQDQAVSGDLTVRPTAQPVEATLEQVLLKPGGQAVTCVLVGLSMLAIAVLLVLLIKYRTHVAFIRASGGLLMFTLLGCLIVNSSTIISVFGPSTTICELTLWTRFLGLYLMLAPIACKFRRLDLIFNNRTLKVRHLNDKYMLLWSLPGFVAICLMLAVRSGVAPYSLYSEAEPKCVVSADVEAANGFLMALLYIGVGLVIITALYFAKLTKEISESYNETRTYIPMLYNGLGLLVVSFIVQNLTVEDVRTLVINAIVFVFMTLVFAVGTVSGPWSTRRSSMTVVNIANANNEHANKDQGELEQDSAALFGEIRVLRKKQSALEAKLKRKQTAVAELVFLLDQTRFSGLAGSATTTVTITRSGTKVGSGRVTPSTRSNKHKQRSTLAAPTGSSRYEFNTPSPSAATAMDARMFSRGQNGTTISDGGSTVASTTHSAKGSIDV